MSVEVAVMAGAGMASASGEEQPGQGPPGGHGEMNNLQRRWRCQQRGQTFVLISLNFDAHSSQMAMVL